MSAKKTGIPERVRVELGERSYDIVIGKSLLSQVAEYLRPLKLGKRGVIITDTNVEPLYAGALCDALGKGGFVADVLSVPAGGASKSLRQANPLFATMPS